MPKVLTVVGNRPQFIKLGVTARALRELGTEAPFQSIVVNTGQHYDAMLADIFFTELQIEPPQYSLGIGSGQIVDQVGKMLQPIREIVETERPNAILVFGDTNSTLAAALVAAHANVPLVHVEGGERLYRRSAMPEEVNRIVTDHLADLLLASSRKAVHYLMREGMGPDRVRFVGDPMYDIFKLTGEALRSRPAAQAADYGLEPGKFVIATMHRAENTDSREAGIAIMDALDAARMPVLLPAHPRLKQRLEAWGWAPSRSLKLIEPLGYFDFQSLLRQSALVVTDSGGVGREAFFAGKGAIVPLESSAWIEAVEAGMSTMVGSDPERLAAALRDFISREPIAGFVEQEFGAGDAGLRIVEAVTAAITDHPRRAEGPWHPVTRFGALPKAVDSTERTHDRFRRHVVSVAAVHGLTFDLTRSLVGAVALGEIAAKAGVSGRLLLPLDLLAFNPFTPEAVGVIQKLLDQGHQLVTSPHSGHCETLAAQFGVAVEPFGAVAHDDADDAFEANGVIRPWLWGKTPLSPFERRLRLIDMARESALDRLRYELAPTPLQDTKVPETVD